MSVKTWGTGGDYATIALALVYAEGLGAFTEDLELRQNSDTTWTDSADYSYDLTGVEMNGYTLSITNPDGYKSTWGTQDASDNPIWTSSRNGPTGDFIIDRLDVDLLSDPYGIYSYNNDQKVTMKDCKWQLKSNDGIVWVIYSAGILDNSLQFIRLYNCSFVSSGSGESTLWGGNSDSNGTRSMENVTVIGFDYIFRFEKGITCLATNCFLDSVDAEKRSGTYVSCATTDDTTDIPANLRSLVLADMFEKYLIEDYDDPDYLKPKSGTVLTSEATYPPTTIGHTLFFDGVEITAELAIIGYRYISAPAGGGGISFILKLLQGEPKMKQNGTQLLSEAGVSGEVDVTLNGVFVTSITATTADVLQVKYEKDSEFRELTLLAEGTPYEIGVIKEIDIDNSTIADLDKVILGYK